MGVLYSFINIDNGEWVHPYPYANTKRPYEEPYSTFIIWIIKMKWNANSVMLMGDCDERIDGWTRDVSKDMTEVYWKQFKHIYEEIEKEREQ